MGDDIRGLPRSAFVVGVAYEEEREERLGVRRGE
jgi:hypothetical protein